MTGSTAGSSPGSFQRPRFSKKQNLFLGAVVLLAALGLQACETTTGPPASGGGATGGGAASSAPGAPAGPRSDAGNSRGNAQAALSALSALSPARIYPAPSTLSGLDSGQVVDLLGPPSFKRRDNPAEIWQYRAPACVLDLFLYRPGKTGSFRVRHFEARGRGKNGVSEKDCFHRLLKAHQARSSG